MTREPALARALTVSTPIPLLPPVTIEVLPVGRAQHVMLLYQALYAKDTASF